MKPKLRGEIRMEEKDIAYDGFGKRLIGKHNNGCRVKEGKWDGIDHYPFFILFDEPYTLRCRGCYAKFEEKN